MKKYTKTITIIIILIIALIMFASFFGIYKTNENGETVNLIPNYKLGMEFGKKCVITASVNNDVTEEIYDSEGNLVEPKEGVEYTEEAGYTRQEHKTNESVVRNLANYKNNKDIFEKRLKDNNIQEYYIALDELTGKMTIEIPENEKADTVQAILENTGSFMLLDGETFEVVLSNEFFERADVVYSQGDIETAVFLKLSFDEEGTKKLQELNNIYVETTSEKVNEEGKKETVTDAKYVWVVLNDAILGQTVLSNILYNNEIMLTFGMSNDNKELQTAIEYAEKEASLVNSGTPTIVYDFSKEIQETKVSLQEVLLLFAAIGVIFIVLYIYLIIAFKAKGFISIYFQIGFLATLLLIIRLTNVTITMEGIVGIVISLVLSFIFNYIVLTNMKQGAEGMYKKSNLQFLFITLPIYVVSIVFTFAAITNINSFGMTLFWGIIGIYVYNFIFSKFVFEKLSIGGKNENS